MTTNQLQATHLMGSDCTYKWLGGNKYEITFAMYRDCYNGASGAVIPDSIRYRLYSGSNSSSYSSYWVVRNSKKTLNLNISNCANPSGICVEQGIFIDTVRIGSDKKGYYISFAANERNNSVISNLERCVSTCQAWQCNAFTTCRNPYGIMWSAHIPPDTIHNSSPYFLNTPVPFMCNKRWNIFNHGGFDPDGDSLVFSLVTPYSPAQGNAIPTPPAKPFNKVVYKSGYSATKPLGSGSSTTINPQTGEIKTYPSFTGNYVLAISIQEYRVDPVTKKAIYLGEIRRDLQFIVGSCSANKTPYFATDPKGTNRTVRPGDTLCFDVKAKDLDTLDELTVTAYSAIINGATGLKKPFANFTGVTDTAKNEPTATLCWTPTCDHITYTSPHTVIFEVNDDGCNKNSITYSIKVKSPAINLPPDIKCINILTDSTIQLFWDTATGKKDFNSYHIWRKKVGGNFEEVDSIFNFNTTSWVDSSVTNAKSTTYRYFIKASNICGLQGLPSDTVAPLILESKRISDRTRKLFWNYQSRGTPPLYYIQIDTGAGFNTIDSTKKLSYYLSSCSHSANYRILIKGNSSCNSYSNEKTVTTSDTNSAAKPEIYRATILPNNSLELAWKRNDSSDVSKYFILRSVNSSSYQLVDSIIPGPDTLKYINSNIDPATNTYCYRIYTVDSCGNYGDTSLPACASKLTGNRGNLSNSLTWTAISGFSPDSLVIQRSAGSGFKRLSGLPVNTTNYTDTKNLQCNHLYNYRVVYYGPLPDANYSFSNSIGLIPYDSTVPASPLIDYVTVISGSTINVNFTNSSEPDVNKHEIFVSKDGGNFSSAGIITTNGLSSVFTHSGVNTGTSGYCYFVRAIDSCSNIISLPSDTHCTMVLTGSGEQLKNKLNWSGYSGFKVEKYYVFRLENGGFIKIDSINGSIRKYTDSLLKCNTPYVYKIVAKKENAATLSESNEITLFPFDSIPPQKPDILNASVNNQGELVITFDTVADQDVNRYEILLSEDNGTFVSKGYISQGLISPMEFIVSQNNTDVKRTCIIVRAIDSCSNNISSADTHCVVLLSGAPGNLKAQLNWHPYKGYTVEKYFIQENINNSFVTIDSVSGADTNFTHFNLGCNIKKEYRILASGTSDIQRSFSNRISVTPFDTIPPAAPVMIYSTINSTGSVYLEFDTVADQDVDRYEVYISENGGSFNKAGTVAQGSSNPLTFTISGLSTRTSLYRVYAIAIDSCNGNISATSDTHRVILLKGTPGNLENHLSWHPYEGFAIGKYYIERFNGSTWDTQDSVAGTDTFYTDPNLLCHQNYIYRIKGKKQAGKLITLSDSISLLPFDTVKPAKVDINYASVKSENKIVLSFNKLSDPEVNRYIVYARVNGGVFSAIDTLFQPFAGEIKYYHTNIDARNNNYCYRVRALDSCGENLSAKTETHCPVQLSGSEHNLENILAWSKYEGFNAKYYNIQVWNGSGWDKLDSTGNENYNHSPIPCNIPVTYRIVTFDSLLGYISLSDTITLTPYDTIIPVRPMMKSVSVNSSNFIELNWKPSSSTDVDKYIIYRNNGSGTLAPLDTISPDSNYIDSSVTIPGNTYCYQVRALDSCANNASRKSDIDCSMKISASVTGCTQVVYLSWTPYVGWDKVKEYRVYRRTDGNPSQLIATLPSIQQNYNDSDVDFHYSYCYRIRAIMDNGNEISNSDSACIRTFEPEVPVITSADKLTTHLTSGEIKINWKSLQASPRLSHYRLYYKKINTSGFSILKDNISLATDSFLHKNLNTKTTDHRYYLTAFDICGNESDSHNIHKTMDIDLKVGQLVHRVKWTKYEGFDLMGYLVQEFRGGTYVTVDTVSPADTFYKKSPAPCNVAIFYRVLAWNGLTTAISDTSGDKAIDTLPADPATFLNTTVRKDSTIDIFFTGADSLDIYAYDFQRSVNSGNFNSSGILLFPGPGGALSFSDMPNTRDNRHCYYIMTLDSCLNATPSDTFCLVQLKGKPLNLANSISWSHFTGYPVDSYEVMTYNNGAWNELTTLPGTDTSFLHDPLPCNIPVFYKIKAWENGGIRTSESDSIRLIPFDTIPPASPDLRYVSVVSPGSVKIVFDTVADQDVNIYQLYRKVNNGAFSGQKYFPQGNTSPIEETQPGLITTDSSYCYFTTAMDSCGINTSLPSDTHCIMLLSAMDGNLENHLSWTGYVGFSVDSYYVERKAGLTWEIIARLPGNQLAYTDNNQTWCNIRKLYRIRALEAGPGEFSLSDTTGATPFDTVRPLPPVIKYATVTSEDKIFLSWSGQSPDAKRYEIWQKDVHTAWKAIDTVDGDSFFTSTGLSTTNNTYCFRIVAIDSCSANRSRDSRIHCVVQLTGNPGNLENHLAWTAYQGFDPVKYYIYEHNGTSWAVIDSVDKGTLNYTHDPLLCQVPYYYRIGALSPGNDISFSDTLELIPFDTIKPLPPVVRKATVNNYNEISIDFEPSVSTDADYYEIYSNKNPDGFTLEGVIPHTSASKYSFKHLNIRADSHYYCYYIQTVDSCQGNISIPGRIHCPVQLEGRPGNLRSELFWWPYIGFKNGTHIIQRKDGNTWIDLGKRTDTSFTDSFNIGCNIRYTYRIMSLSPAGNDTSFSDTVHITPFDTIKPEPAKLKSVTVTLPGEVKISWKASPSKDVKFYEVYNGNNLLDTVTFDSVYYDNPGNTSNFSYNYSIIAIDSCRAVNRAVSSDTDRTLLPHGNTIACYPLITLNWDIYSRFEEGLAAQVIFRSVNSGPFKAFDTVLSHISSYNDTLVDTAKTYCYKVSAISKKGYTSLSDTFCKKPYVYPVPAKSEMIRATVEKTGGNGEVLLEWKKADPSDTLVRGYRLYHANSFSGSFVEVKRETDLSKIAFRHSPVNTSSDNNYYYLEAFNICDTATKRLGETGLPSGIHSPVNLSAENKNLRVDLKWKSYEGFSVLSYNIYKSKEGSAFRPYRTVAGNITSFTDTFLSCEKNYSYRIEAIENRGNFSNSFSDTVSLLAFDTIPPKPVKIIAASVKNGDVQVGFISSKIKNRKAYIVVRASGINYISLDTFPDSAVSGITFTDKFADVKNSSYSYGVLVLDSCGQVSDTSILHRTINLTVQVQNDRNKLTWNHYKGWKQWMYEVHRRTPNTSWKTLARLSPSIDEFIDKHVTCDTNYFYRIVAIEPNLGYYSFSDVEDVIAIETTPPASVSLIRVTVDSTGTTDGSIRVEWDPSAEKDFHSYILYRGTSNGNLLPVTDSIYTNSIVDSALNTRTSQYFYQVEVMDSCGNISSKSSPIHGSIVLTTTPGNEQITLVWNNYSGWNVKEYEIYRDGSLINTVSGTTLIYRDSSLLCTETYSYRVKAISSNTPGIYSYSNRAEASPYDKKAPHAPYLRFATVIDPNEKVRVSWTLPDNHDVAGYELYRTAVGSGEKSSVVFTSPDSSTRAFTDSTGEIEKSYCYKVKAFDHCGNVSKESNDGCIIMVNGVNRSLENEISWDKYFKWNKGVRYYNIYKSPDSMSWAFAGRTEENRFTDDDLDENSLITCYQVEAVEEADFFPNRSRSVVFCLIQDPHVHIPNAFSPGISHGVNDGFAPQGLFIKSYTIRIVNRWGEEIYNGSQPWTGKVSGGNFVESGVYIYFIEVESHNKGKLRFKGTISVLR